MGSKINIINTSGQRFSKKPRINHSNLTADGTNLFIGTESVTEPVGSGGFGGGGYVETTYSDLLSAKNGNELSAGTFYLITDFQTCYDQPDFDHNGNEITEGNYKVAETEPLVVFATSTNTISQQAFSIDFPLDKISYDIDFNETEVTNSPAKGRITERIDDKGNRADYDFRKVQFKRYQGFYCEDELPGTIDINSEGLIVGNNTNFASDFIAGDVLAVYTPNDSPIGCFKFYEILNITDDFSMSVTGKTIQSISNTQYSKGLQFNELLSPLQCNIESFSSSTEFYTFESDSFNTYLGNYANLGNVFLLSNNVFLDGDYNNNYFSDGVFSNTFDDDMNANITGSDFRFNIITNDFDRNEIGCFFEYNIIECDFRDNVIGSNFEYNMIGDEDGYDFNSNIIKNDFERNFIPIYDNFINNTIGENFRENIIYDRFENNTITGSFYQNIIKANFDDNSIGYGFYENNIYNNFEKNSIENYFIVNTIGSLNDVGGYIFEKNNIGNNFEGNQIIREFSLNNIQNNFKGNNVYDDFSENVVANDFEFNNLSGDTSHNSFGNNCVSNTFSGITQYNTIGNDFVENEIGDDFGFGGGSQRGNRIGNNFAYNLIGEYFYNNTVEDGFVSNTVGDYFQSNNVAIPMLNGIDFTSATHVYEDYNCNLIKASGSTNYITFFDGTNQQYVTPINS